MASPISLLSQSAKSLAPYLGPENWYNLEREFREAITPYLTIKQHIDIFGGIKVRSAMGSLFIVRLATKDSWRYACKVAIATPPECITGMITYDECPMADQSPNKPSWKDTRDIELYAKKALEDSTGIYLSRKIDSRIAGSIRTYRLGELKHISMPGSIREHIAYNLDAERNCINMFDYTTIASYDPDGSIEYVRCGVQKHRYRDNGIISIYDRSYDDTYTTIEASNFDLLIAVQEPNPGKCIEAFGSCKRMPINIKDTTSDYCANVKYISDTHGYLIYTEYWLHSKLVFLGMQYNSQKAFITPENVDKVRPGIIKTAYTYAFNHGLYVPAGASIDTIDIPSAPAAKMDI